MNKGLINVVYVVLNYIFNNSSHRLQVTCLHPTLIQLYTYLIYPSGISGSPASMAKITVNLNVPRS